MLKSHKQRQGRVLSRTNKIHGQLSALRKKINPNPSPVLLSHSFFYFVFPELQNWLPGDLLTVSEMNYGTGIGIFVGVLVI